MSRSRQRVPTGRPAAHEHSSWPAPTAACLPVRRPGAAQDVGFVTVAVLALALALLAFGAVLASVGAVAVARHRAAAAADLAALAGAVHASHGQAAACSVAARVALAQSAELTKCLLVGRTVEVRATVRPPGPLGTLGAATATAQAGPG